MPDQASTTGRGRGRTSQWLVLAAAAALVVGGTTWWARDPGTTRVVGDVPAASATSRVAPVAQAVPAAPRPGAPVRLRIPSLGVDAPVRPVKAPNRTLIPPADAQQLGWWAAGARPGDDRGSALVAGHTVHTGGGALDDLEDVERGARVVVRTDAGVLPYVVKQVRTYDKGTLADHAERVFSQDVDGRLVVITCEDWDGVRYLSNVVVTAVPA